MVGQIVATRRLVDPGQEQVRAALVDGAVAVAEAVVEAGAEAVLVVQLELVLEVLLVEVRLIVEGHRHFSRCGEKRVNIGSLGLHHHLHGLREDKAPHAHGNFATTGNEEGKKKRERGRLLVLLVFISLPSLWLAAGSLETHSGPASFPS